MRYILSRQNAEIKNIYTLRLAKERDQQKLFIAEGDRACNTLIGSKTSLKTIYVTEKNMHHISPQIDENKICIVSPHVMEKISQAASPSGILGVFEIPQEPKANNLTNGVVLAQLSDPGNMGTLIRCAAAVNASVVIVEGVDPWSFKVVQASAGYITHVKLFQWTWPNLVAHVQKNNLALAALVVSGGKKPDTVTSEKTLLVIGNEAHGIPSDWLADCTNQITIPMPGNIESLNAAIAGSIALYLVFAQ